MKLNQSEKAKFDSAVKRLNEQIRQLRIRLKKPKNDPQHITQEDFEYLVTRNIALIPTTKSGYISTNNRAMDQYHINKINQLDRDGVMTATYIKESTQEAVSDDVSKIPFNKVAEFKRKLETTVDEYLESNYDLMKQSVYYHRRLKKKAGTKKTYDQWMKLFDQFERYKKKHNLKGKNPFFEYENPYERGI